MYVDHFNFSVLLILSDFVYGVLLHDRGGKEREQEQEQGVKRPDKVLNLTLFFIAGTKQRRSEGQMRRSEE